MRHRTLTPGHAQEVIEKGLSEKETREGVREILGSELSWHLIPIRLSLEEFSALKKIALNGDMEALIRETVRKLISAK